MVDLSIVICKRCKGLPEAISSSILGFQFGFCSFFPPKGLESAMAFRLFAMVNPWGFVAAARRLEAKIQRQSSHVQGIPWAAHHGFFWVATVVKYLPNMSIIYTWVANFRKRQWDVFFCMFFYRYCLIYRWAWRDLWKILWFLRLRGVFFRLKSRKGNPVFITNGHVIADDVRVPKQRRRRS